MEDKVIDDRSSDSEDLQPGDDLLTSFYNKDTKITKPFELDQAQFEQLQTASLAADRRETTMESLNEKIDDVGQDQWKQSNATTLEIIKQTEEEKMKLIQEENDPLYRVIMAMKDKILSFQTELGGTAGKNVVMTVGSTGVGKSTLMNAIIQGSANMQINQFGEKKPKVPLMRDGREVFEIGDKV